MVTLDVELWAEEQFGSCELGDARRTKRAVKLATQASANPDASTPEQTGDWHQCKAAYRLFDEGDVSFDNLCTPHWENTRAREGTWLLINDTTELSFSLQREVSDLAPVGDGIGQGFHLHTCLMVSSDTDEIPGIAGAEIFDRVPAPERESVTQKKKRERESEVWGRVIDLIGPPPASANFIHVCDAGADNFEVFCHAQSQQCGWLIRLRQGHRKIISSTGRETTLIQFLTRLPVVGTYELKLSSNKNQLQRTAKVSVRIGKVSIPQPRQKTPYMKSCGISEISTNVIEVRETNAPSTVTKPLHWILATSEPVNTFEDAWRVISWYEKRNLVEEYHKCLKTGCRIEDRQYRTAARLKRLTGLLSIVAVRLLQMKGVARTKPDTPAKNIVPDSWLTMLRQLRPRHEIQTVGQFFRQLAMFGGFFGRKSDGQPGWITIWRGLKKLKLCILGANAKC